MILKEYLLSFKENISLLEFAIVIQMTMPGVPLIYYGDEVGLIGGRDPKIENLIHGTEKIMKY